MKKLLVSLVLGLGITFGLGTSVIALECPNEETLLQELDESTTLVLAIRDRKYNYDKLGELYNQNPDVYQTLEEALIFFKEYAEIIDDLIYITQYRRNLMEIGFKCGHLEMDKNGLKAYRLLKQNLEELEAGRKVFREQTGF